MQVPRHGLPMIRRLMRAIGLLAVPTACTILLWLPLASPRGPNLIANPSFEIAQPRDLYGRVFAGWEGWRSRWEWASGWRSEKGSRCPSKSG